MSSSLPSRLLARVGAGIGLLLLGWLLVAQEPENPPGVVGAFKGHEETVYSVAFSRDGKTLLSASFDKTVKLWDVSSAKELRTFAGQNGHQNLVLSVAYAPDGQAFASGGADNTAKIWDIPMRQALKELTLTEAVTATALSPDGRILAAAGKDGAIKLWNAADGKELFRLTGHVGPVTALSYAANGQFLGSTGTDNTLRFWNPANGQPVAVVGAHAAPALALGLAPNGTVAYTAGADGLVKFWQLPPVASRPFAAHGDTVTSVALSADGNTLVTGCADKNVRVFNFENGQLARTQAAPNPISTVAIFGTGPNTITAAGTSTGQLLLWANDGKLVFQAKAHAGAVTGIVVHPQGNQLLTTGADGLLKIWALPLAATKAFAHPADVRAAGMTGDGKRLVTGAADNQLRLWNLANAQMERQYPGHTKPVTAVAASVNAEVLVSAGLDDTIRFWNRDKGNQIAQLTGHTGPVTSLVLSPSNQQLLTSSEDGTVKLWQLPVTAPKVMAHPDAVSTAVLTSDGTKLLTGCNDKQARLWNLETAAAEKTFPVGTLGVSAMSLTADNATLAVAGADKSLILYQTATAKELKKITNVPAVIRGLAFSPDGKTLTAGLADNSVRLFDIAKGAETKNLPGHTGPVVAVMYTPKGDLLSASADKTVRFWKPDGTAGGKIDVSGAVVSLALSKDGAKIAVGGADKNVTLWTVADMKPAGAAINALAEIRSVAFSADGQKLAVAAADGRVRVFGLDGKMQESFQHDAAATAVAFHPDGKRVISVGEDKTARVWTSALLWQSSQTAAVRKAIFDAQGQRVFSVGDDKSLRILDVKTGKEQKAIVSDAAITDVAITADGARAVTCGADKSIKVWNLADGKPLLAIPLTNPAQHLALSPNGSRIAVDTTEGKAQAVSVYDAATGKQLLALEETFASVGSLSFLPDNRTLLIAADKNAAMIDTGVAGVLALHPGGITGVAYHPNGTQVFTCGKDKTVKLWELATGKELKVIATLPEAVNALSLSRDGTQLVAAVGKQAKVWNLADGKEIATLAHPADVIALAFSADKARLLTGTTDNFARVWDLATGKEVQSFSHGAAVRAVAFHPAKPNMLVTGSADKTAAAHTITLTRMLVASPQPIRALAVHPNQTHILTAGDDKTVKAWNVNNGMAERTFAGAGDAVLALAVSKNGNLVAAAGADKTIRVYNFADAALVGAFPAGSVVRNLQFHPVTPSLFSCNDDKSIVSWNIAFQPGNPPPPEFGKPSQSFAHPAGALALAFNNDGTNLLSGCEDKIARYWKVASDAPTKNFPHPNLVDVVIYNKDGSQLVTGGHDGVIRIFDVAKGAQLKAINAHVAQPQPFPVYCLAWSPDYKQIVSGSLDRSLKIWDAAGGTLVREIKGHDEKASPKGHEEGVLTLAVSPDGKFVVSGSSDRTIKMWNMADGAFVREFINPTLPENAPKPAVDPKQTPPLVRPPAAHPGWVEHLCYTPDGKYLVSVGGAPRNKGYLAIWNPADGKLVHGVELAVGQIHHVAVSPDGGTLALACGQRSRLVPQSDVVLYRFPVK
ncbi:MAG TPA: hypothetical protein VKS79_09530 [Gemmataceae bacterium]|nr:hypothetical protein [Gemmataceae bacterium]